MMIKTYYILDNKFKGFLNIRLDFTPCPIIYCYLFNLLVLGE